MNELVLFALLFIAIAVGWLLGRRQESTRMSSSELPSEYYHGLNYLLDGRPDGAIDAFVTALEVNTDTLETHITLGNLLRRRGEVERAIRIHQNLLARPSLPRKQIHQAHLELARDYISAGLLDRAERLLLDLVKESPEQRRTSRRHLLEIYQRERDWLKAVAVAEELLPRKSLLGSTGQAEPGEQGQAVNIALSHYHCEQAAQKLQLGEYESARIFLQKALGQDRECVRASIMLGDLEYRCERYKQAAKALLQVKAQDSHYVPETIALLRKCYEQLGDSGALRRYLEECLTMSPTSSLVLAIAEDRRLSEGETAATEFLSEQLSS